jgi:hypothetical protein
MKPKSASLALALALFALIPSNPSSAQIVSQAKTSAGPALTSYAGETFLAWAGISSESVDGKTVHKVGYKINDGVWGAQQIMPYTAINTIAAPALATAATDGSAAQYVYMAWTQDDNLIHYAVWDETTHSFSTTDPYICDSAECESVAAPALAGGTSALYAAWTTASGAIQYATYADGVWTMFPAAVPGVNTKVAPALAVFGEELYLAWVNESNQIQIERAALPLPASGAAWASIPAPASATRVAPALGEGFVGSVPWKAGQELFIAWNNGSAIDFDYWDGAAWIPYGGPIPPGPLENLSPALNFYSTPGICGSTFAFNVGFTLGGDDASEIDWTMVNGVIYTAPSCPKF